MNCDACFQGTNSRVKHILWNPHDDGSYSVHLCSTCHQESKRFETNQYSDFYYLTPRAFERLKVVMEPLDVKEPAEC